jgi:hypothetical protein
LVGGLRVKLARRKKQSGEQGWQNVNAHRPKHAAPTSWRGLAALSSLAWLSVASSGCDIVQGFQDAGDTLFPDQATHLASPGLHLVSGNYRYLDLAAGRELYLLARPTDGTKSLFAMRYANPQPCEIPNVGRYAASRNPSRAQALLSYFHEDAQQGTLHFADTTCKQFDFTIDNASFPVGETESSLIILAGGTLSAVDPEAGTQETLVPAVNEVIGNAFAGRMLVRGGGHLYVFGADWKPQGIFGDGVSSFTRTGKSILYLDSSGLRRLAATDERSVSDTSIATDVCSFGMQDSTWATYYSPCAEKRLVAYNEPAGHAYPLDSSADPRFLRLVPVRGTPGRDPSKDPFWYLFLRDFDATTSHGTLVVRNPKGEEHVIGTNSTLIHAELWESESEAHGYALVDMNGETGNLVWWNPAGETRVLATRMFWRPRRMVVDFDGTVGNVAVASGDRLAIVAERVPWQSFEFQDANRQWTVLFHDWQGYSGQLSAFPGTLDSLAATPVTAPFKSPTLEEVAPDVALYSTSGLRDVLPGAIYLDDLDLTTQTGRLVYRNTELRFTAVVDEGVSDYIVSNDEVLYSVPFGENAGIWLVPGK